jgi:hypothetical protein
VVGPEFNTPEPPKKKNISNVHFLSCLFAAQATALFHFVVAVCFCLFVFVLGFLKYLRADPAESLLGLPLLK